MKCLFLIASTLVLSLNACQFKPNAQQLDGAQKDTIETASGLKYYFVKKGNGRKIEKGCNVSTYLSLQVKDSVVWNTNELPDSLFTFIADYTGLIKGFTEMSLLLREGDEVVAFLPHSIAYGEKGAGNVIPPYATLVYDQFKVVRVDAPKLFLTDTLYRVIKKDGINAVLSTYERIVSGPNAEQYHKDEEQVKRVWKKLNSDGLHGLASEYALKMGEVINSTKLKQKAIESFEKQGDIISAKETLHNLLKAEPENKALIDKLKELDTNQ